MGQIYLKDELPQPKFELWSQHWWSLFHCSLLTKTKLILTSLFSRSLQFHFTKKKSWKKGTYGSHWKMLSKYSGLPTTRTFMENKKGLSRREFKLSRIKFWRKWAERENHSLWVSGRCELLRISSYQNSTVELRSLGSRRNTGSPMKSHGMAVISEDKLQLAKWCRKCGHGARKMTSDQLPIVFQ